MKKATSKSQARSYYWLPLIVMCMVLPVRADQMTSMASSSSQNGSLTVSGFDTTFGTLTEVDLSFSYVRNITVTTNQDTPIFFDVASQIIEGVLDEPDGEVGLFSGFGSVGGDAVEGQPATGTTSAEYTNTITGANLLPFATSSLSFGYSASTLSGPLLDGLSSSNDYNAKLSVTYDYTPTFLPYRSPRR